MAEVLVAGGGPAGATAALLLARAGLAVTIVERSRFPRRKICGEYLNAGAVAALEGLGLGAALRAIAVPLSSVRLAAPRTPAVEIALGGSALACARERLDALLLDAALAAGATLVHGRVRDVVRAGARIAGLQVVGQDDARVLEARWTIGADGADSVVARRAGLAGRARRPARFALGGHYAGIGVLEGTVEMYVCRNEYLALNPLGDGTANVMLVLPQAGLASWTAETEDEIARTAERLSAGVHVPAASRRIGARLATGPLNHTVTAPVAPGLLLVGDAAGMLDPFTGQGVYLALVSAQRAATTILAAAARSSDEFPFARYARDQNADFAARRRLGDAIRRVLGFTPLARHAARKLARAPRLAAPLAEAFSGLGPPRLQPLARLLV